MGAGAVLVVDDSCLVRRLMRKTLTRWLDVTVQEARDGLEALELLGRGCFDLVTLDLQMPGPCGREVFRELRAMPQHSSTPVLFVSGADEARGRLADLLAKDTGFLAKPISLGSLAESVAGLLGDDRIRSGKAASVKAKSSPETSSVARLQRSGTP
jgi:two-component system chemotaxis response regulator CheY